MRQLQHPDLGAQLLRFLIDANVSRTEWELAYELVEACAVAAAEPELVRQCLDSSFPFRRRLTALGVLSKIGSPASLRQLGPLIKAIPAEDKSDEFRGQLLTTLWPAYLSSEEMFSLLVPRRNKGLFGNYQSFLTMTGFPGTLENGLQRENLPVALQWLEQNREGWTQWGEWEESDFGEVAGKVFERAWLATDEPGVPEALAATVAAALERGHDMFFPQEPTSRYAVISAMITADILPEGYLLLFNGGQPLLDVRDWPWAFGQLQKATGRKLKSRLAMAVSGLLRQSLKEVSTPEFLSRFAQLYRLAGVGRSAITDAEIAPECAFLWVASDLEDKTIIQRRAWHLARPAKLAKVEVQKQKKCRDKKRARYLPALHRRNLRYLFAEPIINAWPQWRRLVWYLNYSGKKKHWNERLPGSVSVQKFLTRARLSDKRLTYLIELAWQVVLQHPEVPANRYGDGYQQPGPTIGLALALCWQLIPEQVKTLTDSFWKGWADFLLALLMWSDDPELVSILRHASTIAPAAINDGVLKQADDYNQQPDQTYPLERILNACPVAGLPDSLLARITAGTWYPTRSREVLLVLLKHQYPAARTFAEQIMQLPAIGPAHAEDVVQLYRWHLFEHEAEAPVEWMRLWGLLTQHNSLARDVINEAMDGLRSSHNSNLEKLSADHLQEVGRYLIKALGLAEDPGSEDWGRETMSTRLRQFHDAVVGELASRGTESAWSALQHLQKDTPDGLWLRWRLDQARANLRRNAWQPIEPGVLVSLCRNGSSRWVQSSSDLLDIVLESLQRLQTQLHAETAEANFLWQREPLNPAPGQAQRYVVHNENYVSDYIKRHLDTDVRQSGIVANREVEIRASAGPGTGQRPDILIRAVAPDPTGQASSEYTVIIETKLSKHRHSGEALAEQLVPYLRDNPTWQGLYLVCWHFGQHDAPSKAADLTMMKIRLAKQAAQASARGIAVRALVLDIRLPGDSTRIFQ